MDYNKLLELAQSYLDGEALSPDDERAVREALDTNDRLRLEMAAMRSTKQAIQERAGSLRVQAPRETRIAILESIRNEARAAAVNSSPQTSVFSSFIELLFGRHRLATAGALVLAVAVVYFFMPGPDGSLQDAPVAEAMAEPVDFMADVIRNFHKTSNGDVETKHAAFSPKSDEELRDFFHSNGVDFSSWQTRPQVRVVGAYVTTMEGESIGHVVYRDENNELLCLCQVPVTLFERKCLKLDEKVRRDLDARGHFESEVDNSLRVAMRDNGKTISAVVASLSTPIFE